MLASPLRWVGGKSRLRRQIIPLFPPHERYVEPFGGGGSVLLGKPHSACEVYADLDPELTNFFTVIRDRPHALIRAFQWELVSRARFDELKDTDPETLKPVARAARLYYLLNAGWGGELRYPRFQTAVRDAGGGNRLIGAIKHIERRILPVHERLKKVTIKQGPASEVIAAHDSPETLFYLDPPYPGNGVNYRLNMRGHEAHIHLAQQLTGLKGQFILSSYDRPEIRELYGQQWHYTPIGNVSGMAASGGQGRVHNREVLITNFDPHLTVRAGA